MQARRDVLTDTPAITATTATIVTIVGIASAAIVMGAASIRERTGKPTDSAPSVIRILRAGGIVIVVVRGIAVPHESAARNVNVRARRATKRDPRQRPPRRSAATSAQISPSALHARTLLVGGAS